MSREKKGAGVSKLLEVKEKGIKRNSADPRTQGRRRRRSGFWVMRRRKMHEEKEEKRRSRRLNEYGNNTKLRKVSFVNSFWP